jgi:lipoprotein-anchoring transpeptidase ErfK/SrfK
MKLLIAALAAAVVAAGAAAWIAQPAPQEPRPAASQPPSTQRPAALPREARQGRLFLTKAQLDEARSAGTLDRPVQSLLAVKAPMHFGDYQWNDVAIPSGPTWVRVDLGKQLISVFRGAHEVGTAVIVYGGDNKRTPAGTFPILARDRDHRSSLYDADMPYTLQLTGDGVSIHGSTVRSGKATHGCIGVPLDFARRLFEVARVGDDVVIIPSRKVAAAKS